MLMSDEDWDPTLLDCEGQIDNEKFFETQSSFPDVPDSKSFKDHS